MHAGVVTRDEAATQPTEILPYDLRAQIDFLLVHEQQQFPESFSEQDLIKHRGALEALCSWVDIIDQHKLHGAVNTLNTTKDSFALRVLGKGNPDRPKAEAHVKEVNGRVMNLLTAIESLPVNLTEQRETLSLALRNHFCKLFAPLGILDVGTSTYRVVPSVLHENQVPKPVSVVEENPLEDKDGLPTLEALHLAQAEFDIAPSHVARLEKPSPVLVPATALKIIGQLIKTRVPKAEQEPLLGALEAVCLRMDLDGIATAVQTQLLSAPLAQPHVPGQHTNNIRRSVAEAQATTDGCVAQVNGLLTSIRALLPAATDAAHAADEDAVAAAHDAYHELEDALDKALSNAGLQHAVGAAAKPTLTAPAARLR